jgi:hypothetical protein
MIVRTHILFHVTVLFSSVSADYVYSYMNPTLYTYNANGFSQVSNLQLIQAASLKSFALSFDQNFLYYGYSSDKISRVPIDMASGTAVVSSATLLTIPGLLLSDTDKFIFSSNDIMYVSDNANCRILKISIYSEKIVETYGHKTTPCVSLDGNFQTASFGNIAALEHVFINGKFLLVVADKQAIRFVDFSSSYVHTVLQDSKIFLAFFFRPSSTVLYVCASGNYDAHVGRIDLTMVNNGITWYVTSLPGYISPSSASMVLSVDLRSFFLCVVNIQDRTECFYGVIDTYSPNTVQFSAITHPFTSQPPLLYWKQCAFSSCNSDQYRRCPVESDNPFGVCQTCSTCDSTSLHTIGPCGGYSDTVCAPCTTCSIGYYETVQCNAANSMDRQCALCSSCVAGSTYQSSPCTVTSNTVCSACSSCVAGSTYQTSACTATVNTVCTACSSCVTGSTYRTSACTATSNTVCSACSSCVAGSTYRSSACTATSNTVCSPCSSCVAGSTYRTSACTATADTVCTACSSCVAGSTYRTSACTATADTVCTACSSCVAGSTYRSSACTTTSNTVCSPCSSCVTGSTYRASACNATSNTVCSPCSSCVAGSTYRTSACTATADTVCSSCLSCAGGSVLYTACTNTTQAVCSRCPFYTLGSTCADSVPFGHFPHVFRYPAAVLSVYQQTPVVFPTFSEGNVLDWTSDVFMTVLIPCAVPPPNKRIIPYTSGSVAITCNKIPCDAVVNVSSTCSLECNPYDGTHGYFGDGNICFPCTTQSTYSPCDWGQYANLTSCGPVHDSTCALCHGTLPANAIWTIPNSPNYFSDSVSEPCQWDCVPGFYKLNNACAACTPISNSLWLPGDLGGSSSILWKLNTGTSKFVGGNPNVSAESRCNFQCLLGYKSTLNLSVGPYYFCEDCTSIQCATGMTSWIDTETGCKLCTSCLTPPPANAAFATGCDWICNKGYYRSGSTCILCDTSVCPTGQFRTTCSNVSNSICAPCTSCMPGTYASIACGIGDTVCSTCSQPLPANAAWTSGCVWQCNPNYVSNGSACVACRTSLSQCSYNQQVTTNCTLENLGCAPCAVPQTYNWCWTGTSQCSWACLVSYLKVSGKCTFYASITSGPNCVDTDHHLPPTTSAPHTTSTTTATETSTAAPQSPVTTTADAPPIQTTTTAAAPLPLQTTTTAPIQTTSTAAALPLQTTTTAPIQTTSTAAPLPLQTTTTAPIQTTSTAAPLSHTTTSAAIPPSSTTPVSLPVDAAITVATLQMSLSSAVCSLNSLRQKLSQFYSQPAIILSFSDGQSAPVLCHPTLCPCVFRRRNLLASPSVTMRYWYPGPLQNSVGIETVIPAIVPSSIQVESPASQSGDSSNSSNTIGIALGVTFSMLFLACVVFALYWYRDEVRAYVKQLTGKSETAKPKNNDDKSNMNALAYMKKPSYWAKLRL